ncbi:hypothetical protein SRABI118_02505 [Massilia sp. Bi118]|uniref:hypothetical protein n=1 Tax=Massilia sp. Bi118 TaxID=2822346 RepID=UPI001D91093E|nr:hypothetical protein [Massilia sp. Bi118]CAH0232457.1 hypothetical protein SRABI118_02505 [Massilia sp. Bi118]
MKHLVLLAAACSALLAGCAAESQDSAGKAGPEETWVPTGSLIARRNVDRASAVKSASKEEMENSRVMGGGALNLPRN